MRGRDEQQKVVFSYIDMEQRVPEDHPLRPIREMVDGALRGLDLHLATLYAKIGRDSIPPERLLRALLLMVLYSIPSERRLMEQLKYNILYRWFVGLNLDDEVWDVTVFTKNRERLMKGEVSWRLLEMVMEQARARALLSEEHFTVDGTLIQAWANRKSFQAKVDPPPPGEGSGHKGAVVLRDTHESKTDAEARLYKKSTAAVAVPSYLGHVVIENRNGLVVASCATQSSTTAEREAALRMLDKLKRSGKGITLGADKQYQDGGFVRKLRERDVIPHVAEYESGQNDWKNRQSNFLEYLRCAADMVAVVVAGDVIVDTCDSELLQIRDRLVAVLRGPIIKEHYLSGRRNQDRSVSLAHVHEVNLQFAVGWAGLRKNNRRKEQKEAASAFHSGSHRGTSARSIWA